MSKIDTKLARFTLVDSCKNVMYLDVHEQADSSIRYNLFSSNGTHLGLSNIHKDIGVFPAFTSKDVVELVGKAIKTGYSKVVDVEVNPSTVEV